MALQCSSTQAKSQSRSTYDIEIHALAEKNPIHMHANVHLDFNLFHTYWATHSHMSLINPQRSWPLWAGVFEFILLLDIPALAVENTSI